MSILKWYVKEKDGSPGLGSIGHAKWVLALVSVHFWQHSSVLNYPQKYCSEVVVGWKACVLSHHNYYCICSCICFDNSLTMIQIWIDDLSWMHLSSTRSEYSQLIFQSNFNNCCQVSTQCLSFYQNRFFKLVEHLWAKLLIMSAQCIIWKRSLPHFRWQMNVTDFFFLLPVEFSTIPGHFGF